MKIKEFSDSCQQVIKSHPKQTIAIVISVVVIIVLICLLSLRSCSNTEPVELSNTQAAESLGATTSTSTESQKSEESSTAPSVAPSPVEETTMPPDQMTSVEAQSDAAQASGSGQQSNPTTANIDVGTTAPTPSNSSPAPSAPSSGGSANTAPSKTWVVDYTQTWVQDSAAWDESIPTYGYEEKSICNVCGAEITGNETAHGKAHMMAGEGSGHHTEYIQVVTGSQTIHHDATGHYETVESGGHWE